MATSPAPHKWPQRLGLGFAAGVVALVLTQAVSSREDASPEPPALSVNEPITQVDARLVSAGWAPHPEQEPLPLERNLAGNNLASLSACSGTGQGFCRYDYRRGNEHLAVVTVPRATGGGLVHNWFQPE